ncbi:MAG: hypothetical protein YK1309IOTA_1590002, partial [Marine Group I thaumarchaeote]
MRIDSCRKCGITLQEFQACSKCRKAIKFICPKCNSVSDEQIHFLCILDK